MKRKQLIEWGIIVIGIVIAYRFFMSIFSVIVQLVYSYDNTDFGKSLIRLLVIAVIYALGFILIIRNSTIIAGWINGPAENEPLTIKINKGTLLQVTLIGICVITILSNTGETILYLANLLRNTTGQLQDPSDNFVTKHHFIVSIVELVVAVAVLCFSKDITGWFIQKNEIDKPAIESFPENIS